jgi:glycosyltransferase involved in cell wall biosynthesis
MNRTWLGQWALEAIKRLDLDILQIEQEPVAIWALPWIKKLSIPVVLNFHGIWAEELVDRGVIGRQEDEYRILQNMVKKAVRQMDAVLASSDEMRQYIIQEYNATHEKVHVVGMGAQPRISKLPVRDKPIKVIFVGLFSKEKHVDLFLESIPYIVEENKDIVFYITGRGDMVNEARKIGKKFGAKIEFFWFDDERDLFEFMPRCHFGILTRQNNFSYRINPPAKVFDYMSVGLPVVTNDIGGWIRRLQDDDLGVLTKNDPVDFAKGVLHLAQDPALALEYSRRCLEASANKYSLNAAVGDLLTVYRGLLKN